MKLMISRITKISLFVAPLLLVVFGLAGCSQVSQFGGQFEKNQVKEWNSHELTGNKNIEKYQQSLKEITSVDTSDWKTYHHDKYGFEMKYPDSWIHFTRKYTNNNMEFVVFYNKKCDDNKGDETEYESFEDCSNFVEIEISGNSPEDELDRRRDSGWSWTYLNKEERDMSSGRCSGKSSSSCCGDAIPLKFDNLPEVQSCSLSIMTGFSSFYYFPYKNNHYLLTIKYNEPDYIPSTEKAILESFKFTN